MKHILIILIFTGLFSFLGFDQEPKDTISIHDTSLKISQTQLDELYQLSSYGINLIKNKYVNHDSFLPILFSYSNTRNFKVIPYKDPLIEDRLLSDYASRILIKIAENELKKDSIRIICIVYNGVIKNVKYPEGSDCLYLLFISKGFDNSVLISYPLKTEKEHILLGDVEVQIVKK
jgi:hypothetical protein